MAFETVGFLRFSPVTPISYRGFAALTRFETAIRSMGTDGVIQNTMMNNLGWGLYSQHGGGRSNGQGSYLAHTVPGCGGKVIQSK